MTTYIALGSFLSYAGAKGQGAGAFQSNPSFGFFNLLWSVSTLVTYQNIYIYIYIEMVFSAYDASSRGGRAGIAGISGTNRPKKVGRDFCFGRF